MQGPETRASLIGRLGDPASTEAWAEFTEIYRPLVVRVARAKGLQHADADDLAQDVFTIVSRAVESFDPAANGSFRGWLFTITRNLCVNHLSRSRKPIGSGDSDIQRLLLQQPADDATVTLFEMEHRRVRFRRAAEGLKQQFTDSTWLSFWLTAVDGKSIDAVAQQLNKSSGAVRVARCRVLARLKDKLRDED